jgi:hypothetical protein
MKKDLYFFSKKSNADHLEGTSPFTQCGECEGKLSQDLPIPVLIGDVAEFFEK